MELSESHLLILRTLDSKKYISSKNLAKHLSRPSKRYYSGPVARACQALIHRGLVEEIFKPGAEYAIYRRTPEGGKYARMQRK